MHTCLLVDFKQDGLAQNWRQLVGEALPMKVEVVSPAMASQRLEKRDVLCMLMVTDQAGADFGEVLRSFSKYVGLVGSLQAVVCEDPSVELMAAAFEFGVDRFVSEKRFGAELRAFVQDCHTAYGDDESVVRNVVALNQAMDTIQQDEIKRLAGEIGEASAYDYLAAFYMGRTIEAAGDFGQAVSAFKQSHELNKYFLPTSMKLAENLMVVGSLKEAVTILEKMERSNPKDASRKAALASAYEGLGMMPKALAYAEAARSLAPGNPRVVEIEAQLMLAKGEIDGALALMDGISDAGPYFAAKLNEIGIHLSQHGRGAEALALYKKAHKVVRAELCFKISLNAALAAHRMQDHKLALEYLARCEEEHGGTFEKLEKIRGVVKKHLIGLGDPAA